MLKTSILVVDDDELMVKFLTAGLTASGYHVLTASDGESALQIAAQQTVDLVLLDIMLPGIDGEEVCRRIRDWSPVPIIMITAKGATLDKVRLLDLGADDYITKPFSIEEVLARLRASLRRSVATEAAKTPAVLVSDELQIDFESQRVTVGGKDVHLTRTEYDILKVLALNADKVVTSRDLIVKVWGCESESAREYVRTYIKNLRHKIEADPGNPKHIHTWTGVGYFLQTAQARTKREPGTS